MCVYFPKVFSPSVLSRLADFAVLNTHKKAVGKILRREASFKPFMTPGNVSLCQGKMGVKRLFVPRVCGTCLWRFRLAAALLLEAC